MITHQGVLGDQQRQVGCRGSDRIVGCYLSGLPVDAIKVLAGFTIRKGYYYINRDTIAPPALLEKMFFLKSIFRNKSLRGIFKVS
ncbi:hypothetical protein A0J61_11008 [Choanephora cucurbitarum]|uniref:Uncharacterized protein n=1 Tax=Choanephora cucurbitarum TaxID=101091 RepID=A0A1C7MVW7_9FUNG|nr:hypothetical protein A0J61_11008 [Choanephora cucurbitarum]